MCIHCGLTPSLLQTELLTLVPIACTTLQQWCKFLIPRLKLLPASPFLCYFSLLASCYCFVFPRNCIECLAEPAEAQDKVLKPALVCSLFPNVPPTIYFSTRDETGELGSVVA